MKKELYESIRQDIIDGKLKGGQPLTQEFLGNQFKTSRTPVREVLSRLESEGLIKNLGRKGAFVQEITPIDVSEIYELRIILESHAAGVCAQIGCKDTAKKIKEELQEVNKKGVALSYKIEAGLKLHRFIIAATENSRLKVILNHLEGQILRTRYLAAHIPARVEKYHKQHLRIAEAICSGNKIAAEKRMKEHLTITLRDILKLSNFSYVFALKK